MATQFDPTTDKIITLANLQRFGSNVKDKIDEVTWSGTKSEFETASAAGKIAEGSVVNITDDYDDKEFYTKDEINQLIGSVPKFTIATTADHTAITDPSTTTVYLQNGESGVNLYTEWIYTSDGWYKLGEQPVTSATISDDGTLYV